MQVSHHEQVWQREDTRKRRQGSRFRILSLAKSRSTTAIRFSSASLSSSALQRSLHPPTSSANASRSLSSALTLRRVRSSSAEGPEGEGPVASEGDESDSRCRCKNGSFTDGGRPEESSSGDKGEPDDVSPSPAPSSSSSSNSSSSSPTSVNTLRAEEVDCPSKLTGLEGHLARLFFPPPGVKGEPGPTGPGLGLLPYEMLDRRFSLAPNTLGEPAAEDEVDEMDRLDVDVDRRGRP